MNAPPVISASNSPPNARCTCGSNARLTLTRGLLRVSSLLSCNHAIQNRALPRRQLVELRAQPALQVLHDHRHQRHISDAVAHKSIAHKLRTQRAQMHHARSAHKRSDESHHEIDRVIRGQNTQVPHSRPEWIPRRQRPALLQIIFVREHAAFRASARSRRIHDAGHIVPLAHDEIRRAFALEVLPPERACQFRAQRGFGHENELGLNFVKVRRLHDRAPQVVLDDQHFSLANAPAIADARRR